jgi:uncharacterized membrane protein YgcG
MNAPHLELETISAYIDGELSTPERDRIAQHLTSCPSCAASTRRMQGAVRSVAALDPVQMTIDEHRTLRQAVLGATRPAARRWSLGRLQWSAAGAFALIAVAVVGFTFLRSAPRQADEVESATEAMAPAEDSALLTIESDDQIRDAVLALPEVQERLRRSGAGPEALKAPAGAPPAESDPARDSGVTAKAQPAGEPRAPARTGEDAGGAVDSGRAGGDEASRGGAGGPGAFGATTEAAEAGSALAEEAGAACLTALAASQSQPLNPIAFEEVLYEGTPAWLLVYDVPQADDSTEIKSYVVGRQDCANLTGDELDGAVLARSSFRP